MKRQKNWRKVSSVVLGLMAAGIIALLAGCPSPESPGRTGVVRVSIGEVARTLLPENPIFTKYELTFTPSSGTAVTTEVLNPVAGSAIEVALATGDWTLALTAYTTPSGSTGYYPAAYGTAPFSLASGVLDVPITINPIDGSDDGIFEYTITYPTSLVSGTMTLTGPSGAGIGLPGSGVLSLGGSTSGSIALAPGVYTLFITLNKDNGAGAAYRPIAGTSTAVHIYQGLVTEAAGSEFTFTPAHFVDEVYLAGTVDLTVPSSMTVKEVTVAAYSNEGCTVQITPGGVDTIRYPSFTPGTASPIPWFLSIPLSAAAADIWLAATVTDGNDQPFTSAPVKQDAGTIPRNGTVGIGIPIFVNSPGVTVTGSGSAGVFVDGRTVTVAPFVMAEYETTYELWYEVRVWAAANGYTFANQGREGHDGTNGAAPTTAKDEPVTTVNWRDVIVWCNAYSEKSGKVPVYTYQGAVILSATDTTACDNAEMDKTQSGFRLPTEVEWEFAARGGNPNDTTNWGYTYAGSNTVGGVAWYYDNSGSATHPVGGKAPNSLGLYDMSGNVFEWCWDWYGSVSGSTTDGPTSGSYRLLRGGGWGSDAYYAEVSYRGYDTPSLTNFHVGFRVVCPPSS